MSMRCSICGKYGIYWKNLHTVDRAIESHYTYCPHCENTNCQEDEDEKGDGDETH